MRNKRAIVYLRISNDRQSNYSIEGQRMHILSWCERNHVEVVDVFVDEGYSARNFDRPDYQRLNKFIHQHYRTVDYLAVNSFDRFSRDAGEAIIAIKKLQRQYAIKVVSVTEGVTFDADDPGSFFYAGLMLLKGEDEIIRNRNRINLGIYTAKKKEGRYLGAAPIGYKNARDEQNKPVIIPDPEKAHIIKFIYQAFLDEVPIKEILIQAKEMGFNQVGNSVIPNILSNPVYVGQLRVRAYKDFPEEMVDANHEPLIDRVSWYDVQDKLHGRKRGAQTILNEEMPLRHVLLCHCGKPLTGAPSKGKSGRYYYYYKCPVASQHNNISVSKAHEQLEEVFHYLSLPEDVVRDIRHSSGKLLEQKYQVSKIELKRYQKQLNQAEEKLKSVETKYVNDQMAYDTYNRWFGELNGQKQALNAQIEKLSRHEDNLYNLLDKELYQLTDMKYIYKMASAPLKQQLVRQVFELKLHYREGVYRTPSLNKYFMYNEQILTDKRLLFIEKKMGNCNQFPSGGAAGSRTLVQTNPPYAFYMLI